MNEFKFDLQIDLPEAVEENHEEAHEQFALMFEHLARYMRAKKDKSVSLKKTVASIQHEEFGKVKLQAMKRSEVN